jgi:serine/threonine protein kinase
MDTKQELLSRYELQQRLHSDATSETWKAFDTQQRHFVIVKILHPSQPGLMDRFSHDIPILTSLRHPNIVPISTIQIAQSPDQTASSIYMVMEYVEGQLLSSYLQATAHTGKFLPPDEILRILTPIGSAIDYAHKQGVMHGAIRPNNVLLTQTANGEPRMIGFEGHILQPPATRSLEDAAYIAPEQAQGYTENARR